VVHATVAENESIYTRSEIKKAKEAYEFHKCSGYPLPDEAIHLFQDGNIFGLSDLTREDLIRAYDIYGMPVAYVRGKLTKKAISCAVIDPSTVMRDMYKHYIQMLCIWMVAGSW
jgi:hypothetical protein